MRRKSIFWGLSLIAIAIFIVVYQMGIISNEISVWSVVLGILFGGALIDGIFSLSFGGIFFPLAFLWSLFGEMNGFPKVSIWILLLAALFLTIGFSIIFPKKKGHWKKNMESFHQTFDSQGVREIHEGTEDGQSVVNCYNRFGAVTKYITTDNLVSATLDNQFGEMIIYFDNAKIQTDYADVYVNASFGSVKIFIPKEWRIDNCIRVMMGDVSEKNQSRTDGIAVLRLHGNVSFGDLEIIYI